MDDAKKGKRRQMVPDLSLESERLRLGSVGLKAFLKIAARWKLTDEELLTLLALEDGTSVEQLKLNPAPQLFTEDRMLRISNFIKIYKGLHTLYGKGDLADTWVRQPNQNPVFGGISPLEFMICSAGGQSAIHQVLILITARCAGN